MFSRAQSAPVGRSSGGEPPPEPGEKEEKKGYYIQREVEKFLRFAYTTFEARGYAGSVEVEWKLGVYEEGVQQTFERKESTIAPWTNESTRPRSFARQGSAPLKLDGATKEAGSELAARDRKLLDTMFARLEQRAKDWTTTSLRDGDDDDDLTGVPSSRDPLVTTKASIGFSIFGIGWQVSICIKAYLSRLRRWRCRAWELRVDADSWRPLFDAVVELGRDELPVTLVEEETPVQFDTLVANEEAQAVSNNAPFVSGAALRRALETTPLFDDCFGGVPPSTDALRHAWHLCDLGARDGLTRDEFALFVFLLRALLVDGQKLPAALKPDLLPPRIKGLDRSS